MQAPLTHVKFWEGHLGVSEGGTLLARFHLLQNAGDEYHWFGFKLRRQLSTGIVKWQIAEDCILEHQYLNFPN